jgi:hypothetical protein
MTASKKALDDSRERRERMEEPPRERLAQPSTQDAGRNRREVQGSTTPRPDMVTFAAAVMFALGGFHVLLALSEFARSTWVLSRLDVELFVPILVVLGILDLIIGAIALYAGFSVLRGGAFGLIMGFAFAVLGIIRWLFYIPVSPVLAVVIIALDVLVIYGLIKDYEVA